MAQAIGNNLGASRLNPASLGTGGAGAGGCCKSGAADCCKKGLACCQGKNGVDKGGLVEALKQLMQIAQQDPKAVTQALGQNPEFAQILKQGVGGVPGLT